MKQIADRRARVARVRNVQHLQATIVAEAANARVVDLETNAGRLAEMRGALAPGAGLTSGAALGGARELMARLEAAEQSLAGTIATARIAAQARQQERLEARIAQEGAEKLEARAVHAMQEMLEARLAAIHRTRPKGGR